MLAFLLPTVKGCDETMCQIKRILLDAGHGGKHLGAVAHGVTEKDITIEVVRSAGRILKRTSKFPIDVHYTRIEDEVVSLSERLNDIKLLNPHAFVSVHCNASVDNPSTSYDETQFISGTEIFYRDAYDLPLAHSIDRLFLRSKLWDRDRGIKNDVDYLSKRLTVLNNLKAPCVLVEIGFLTHNREREMILENISGIASLLAHGIIDFLDRVVE